MVYLSFPVYLQHPNGQLISIPHWIGWQWEWHLWNYPAITRITDQSFPEESRESHEINHRPLRITTHCVMTPMSVTNIPCRQICTNTHMDHAVWRDSSRRGSTAARLKLTRSYVWSSPITTTSGKLISMAGWLFLFTISSMISLRISIGARRAFRTGDFSHEGSNSRQMDTATSAEITSQSHSTTAFCLVCSGLV